MTPAESSIVLAKQLLQRMPADRERALGEMGALIDATFPDIPKARRREAARRFSAAISMAINIAMAPDLRPADGDRQGAGAAASETSTEAAEEPDRR